jgi:hypothetical protein
MEVRHLSGVPVEVRCPFGMPHIGPLPGGNDDLQADLGRDGAEGTDLPADRFINPVEHQQQSRTVRQGAAQVIDHQRPQACR